MGFYSRYIFPRFMDAMLSGAEFRSIRESVLAEVSGEVCEIGFGTGLNLPHYPSHVKRITAVDPNAGMQAIAQQRIAQSTIKVVRLTLHGESLPLENDSFDSVVCTFALCSIRDVDRAVLEMKRILNPAGRLHFVEHGLCDDPRVQWWQHKLTPLQRTIADGCHLDRDVAAILRRNGFQLERLDNFYLKSGPRFGSYIYRGVAALSL